MLETRICTLCLLRNFSAKQLAVTTLNVISLDYRVRKSFSEKKNHQDEQEVKEEEVKYEAWHAKSYNRIYNAVLFRISWWKFDINKWRTGNKGHKNGFDYWVYFQILFRK